MEVNHYDNFEDDEVCDDDNDADDYDPNVIFDVVVPGQIIALRTPPEEKDSFYLVVVNEVKSTDTDIFDAYQHFVLKNHRYLSCNYLEINKEHKKYIQYNKRSAEVFAHPEQVLSPFVNITDDFKLSYEEKQWLCDCA